MSGEVFIFVVVLAVASVITWFGRVCGWGWRSFALTGAAAALGVGWNMWLYGVTL